MGPRRRRAGATAERRAALLIGVLSVAVTGCFVASSAPPDSGPAVPVASAPPRCPPGLFGTPPDCGPLPDADGDGVADRFDRCPSVVGVASVDPELHGCPRTADSDGDGVQDSEDVCPRQSGPDSTVDPAVRGCPARVRLTRTGIDLVARIDFDFDKAVLRPESLEVIDDLARLLNEHPELALVEVQGHLGEANRSYSRVLSQTRAEMVRKELIRRGVEPARLTAKGYEDTRPLVLPSTEEARARNRRIEVKILEPAPR